MRYQLYYWSGIQGRGEFVRLALEDAGADYVDVTRVRGDDALIPFLQGEQGGSLPFAPPFLKASRTVIAQTAAILLYLAPRLKLVPAGSAAQLYAHQLQLTITDLVAEVHDTHHPIASNLYYEDQRAAARQRAEDFRRHRLPKYLDYFEQVLIRSDGRHALPRHSYVDLSLFQIISGLDYAYPHAMRRLRRKLPHLCGLAGQIAERPRIAAYLTSPRRLAFNEDGIFRHYPELDATR
ncbi:MAG: glutathione S-transferase [Rhodanobacter sp.]